MVFLWFSYGLPTIYPLPFAEPGPTTPDRSNRHVVDTDDASGRPGGLHSTNTGAICLKLLKWTDINYMVICSFNKNANICANMLFIYIYIVNKL